ncbi:MAG: phosphoribosyl-AMP cyclohydrolase [Verrucomicrobiales bacterium]|jgi:phosphoribosyl-AMP cyclohydrolase|nr:phosphoribosyl-AMP cyclohydrolase [Verrucomicrobiales bacterium]
MTDWQNIFAERGDQQQLETSALLAPKFDRDGLIPAVATDYDSGEVLMFAYMNREALTLTIKLGEAVYWSRSRREIWHKGATSGNVQVVRELRIDCDQDALWLRVTQRGCGSACHTGYRSCFYRAIPTGAPAQSGLALVFKETEKLFDPEKVYGKK